MFGQAPGIQEGQERLPWRGRAGTHAAALARHGRGDVLRDVLLRVGHALLPGSRRRRGRGDRTPTPREQELCAFWREWEFELMRPQLIVTVGGLAARRLLGVKSVTESVGVRYELDGAVAIPLPHPSGASGWLNDPGEPRARRGRGAHDRRGARRPRTPGLGRLELSLELRLLGRALERERRGEPARDHLRHLVEVARADLALVTRRGVALLPRARTRAPAAAT